MKKRLTETQKYILSALCFNSYLTKEADGSYVLRSGIWTPRTVRASIIERLLEEHLIEWRSVLTATGQEEEDS